MTSTRVIRWGMLGTGRVASLFAAALHSLPGSRLVAVGSRNAARAQRFATMHHIDRHYDSYEALAGDKDLDIVYIATPNNLHLAHALLCLTRGRHILVEKPLALDAGEAATIIAAAQQRGLFCMEAMWARFAPPYQALQQQLAQARAGSDSGAEWTFSATLGFAHRFDPADRLFDPALGGGVTLDLAVYPLSLLTGLFGPAQVRDVQVLRGPTGVDEELELSLHFAGGPSGTVMCSFRRELANELTLNDRRVAFTLAPLYMPTRLNRQTPNTPTAAAPAPMTTLKRIWQRLRPPASAAPASPLQGYQFEAQAVADCLRAGMTECPAMSHDASLQVMRLLDAIRAQAGAYQSSDPIR